MTPAVFFWLIAIALLVYFTLPILVGLLMAGIYIGVIVAVGIVLFALYVNYTNNK